LEICNHEYKKLFSGENGVLVPTESNIFQKESLEEPSLAPSTFYNGKAIRGYGVTYDDKFSQHMFHMVILLKAHFQK